MNILRTNIFTRYKNAAKAAEVAAACTADDDCSTYTVTASGDAFVIVIHDEDGFKLGCL